MSRDENAHIEISKLRREVDSIKKGREGLAMDYVARETDRQRATALSSIEHIRTHLDDLERGLQRHGRLSYSELTSVGRLVTDLAEASGKLTMLAELTPLLPEKP